MTEAIFAAVGAHYAATLARHGASAQGVDWKDDDGHRLRHSQFLRLIAHDPEASVLDMGCGYGDFLPFLRAQGHRGRYVGTDIAPAMLDAARARHGEGARHGFILGMRAPEPSDYAIGSGILNVIRGADPADWARYVDATIDALAAASRRGFAFNMLSLSSDPERRRADLHYADPATVMGHCLARFGRHVAVLQDYGLWEFTVIVRHASSQTASPKPVAP